MPSAIGEELAFNPFMRVGQPTVGGADDENVTPRGALAALTLARAGAARRSAELAQVQKAVGGGSDVEVMRKLRNAKDSFAGSSRPWIPGGGPLPGL